MRAASLPRFLQSLIAVRATRFAPLLFIALIALLALLAFGALGVAAADGPSPDVHWPFRW